MTTLRLLRSSGVTGRAAQGVRGFCSERKPCLALFHKWNESTTPTASTVRAANSSGSILTQLTSVNALKSRRKGFFMSAKMKVELPLPRDRCAIITGVAIATGIGRILVRQFLNSGYKVVGADICELEEGPSTEMFPAYSFHFVQADISDPLQAKRIVDEATQKFGGSIHVLINNAGITNPTLSGENRIKAFADIISVNLNGAYYMSQFALPYMPVGQSSIIHISSTRALQSEPDSEGYAASKAGLCGLTHAQAITLSGKVRVNAVLPGYINTDPLGDSAIGMVDHEWHPVGRVGVPDDVAHMCLFLCDPERAGFITGQQFVVDGGMTKKMVYPGEEL